MTHRGSIYLLGGSITLTIIILGAWLAELGRWHALTTRPVLRFGARAVMAAAGFGMVALEVSGMLKHGTQVLVPIGAGLTLWAADAMPNAAVIAVVAILPVGAAFLLLRWQLGRSDVAGGGRKR